MQQIVFHANDASVHVCTRWTLECIFILYLHVHEQLAKHTYVQQARLCQSMSAYKASYINIHAHVYLIVYIKVILGHFLYSKSNFHIVNSLSYCKFSYSKSTNGAVLTFRLQTMFTNAWLLGGTTAWRYAWEYAFDDVPVCAWGCPSTSTDQHASEDESKRGRKSTELGCIASLCHLCLLQCGTCNFHWDVHLLEEVFLVANVAFFLISWLFT